MQLATAGAAGGALAAVVFIIALVIYGVVYNALNLNVFDAGTQSLLGLIGLVLVGGFIISLLVAFLGRG